MALQCRTLQKLMREDFPGTTPLVVAAADRAKVAADIKAKVERFEGVDTKDYGFVREEEKPRHVCSFSITDRDAYYYYASRNSFRLLLDDGGRLTIQADRSGTAALV